MNIKKIIKEEINNFDWVDEIETPLSWLIDNFGDLTPVVKNNKTFYVDDENTPLFYYYKDIEIKYCNFDYSKVWLVLESRFHLKNNEVKSVITKFLGSTYNITNPKIGVSSRVSHLFSK